jgi:hypothetical protein
VTRSLRTPVPSETDTQPLIDMALSPPAAARPGYIGRADTRRALPARGIMTRG